MDVFSFLFQTRGGFAVLFIAAIVVFLIVAFVSERKTRKMYVDRGERKDGEGGWGLFDD